MGKYIDLKLCKNCGLKCENPCAALRKLYKVYKEIRVAEKTEIIRQLRKELDIWDSEVADDLRELGEKIIKKIPELDYIPEFDIRIGYVRSYFPKKDKGRFIYGDCRKVNQTFAAYLPYDFVITLYEPNIANLSESQIKILMLHELKHIGIGQKGFVLNEHEIEDFHSILKQFGIDWNGYDEEVKDILE